MRQKAEKRSQPQQGSDKQQKVLRKLAPAHKRVDIGIIVGHRDLTSHNNSFTSYIYSKQDEYTYIYFNPQRGYFPYVGTTPRFCVRTHCHIRTVLLSLGVYHASCGSWLLLKMYTASHAVIILEFSTDLLAYLLFLSNCFPTLLFCYSPTFDICSFIYFYIVFYSRFTYTNKNRTCGMEEGGEECSDC